MTLSVSGGCPSNLSGPKFNWPIVSLLLFMCAVPALPAIYLLSVIVLGAPADGQVHPFVPMHYFVKPIPILVHGVAGILFFLTVPFQFSPVLRLRGGRWHKISGRVALSAGYTMAFSGLWLMHHPANDMSLPRYIGFFLTSVGMMISFAIALYLIIAGNSQRHRVWMMRALAITLGGVTAVLAEGLLYLGLGNPDEFLPGMGAWINDYSRLIGLLANLIIVQWVLMREQVKRAQSAEFSDHISAAS